MSIPSDDTSNGMSDDAAVAALMGSLQAPKTPKAAPAAPLAPVEDAEEEDEDLEDLDDEDEDQDFEEEDLEDDEELDDADEDAEDEEEGEDPASGADPVADDAVVSVVVDGVEQQLTVGSLKRLAGQEAALTRKSQEADLVGQRAAATLQGALEVVLEDLQAYANVDWVLEGSRMDPEEFEWHRQQYQTLTARRDRLINGARSLEQTTAARRQAQLKQEAAEAVKVLSDPNTGIKGWSDELYGDILDYAIGAGLPEEDVAQITNPSVIKLINKARLYDQGHKAAAKKVNLTPARVRKGGAGAPVAPQQDKAQAQAMKKLRSGRATDEDAIAALVGRWGVKRR